MTAPGVAIVGCGLIGGKRAHALGDARLLACADLDEARARQLAAAAGNAAVYTDWRQAIRHPGIDIVIVATLHDTLARITAGAIAAGCHVLVEKPAGLAAVEVEPLIALAATAGRKVRVGFNHRYHRAVRKAREIVASGALGELMFVRGRYGHGGRLGYEKEWRANPRVSGGGELIDQGPHLIDLARLLLGDFTSVQGHAGNYYWDMPVDDNAFLLLRTATERVAHLHVSCTEWKNMFSFEIYGRQGKLDIAGRGGSYGVERLTHYHMLPGMGPPETTAWEYPMADDSWQVEFAEFLDDIRLNRTPAAGLADAVAVLRVIGEIYRETNHDHHT